jgi:hypothetical protein
MKYNYLVYPILYMKIRYSKSPDFEPSINLKKCKFKVRRLSTKYKTKKEYQFHEALFSIFVTISNKKPLK